MGNIDARPRKNTGPFFYHKFSLHCTHTYQPKAFMKALAASSVTASPDQLWASFRQGSRDAFSILYHEHVDHLYHYGVHFCGNTELVRDHLQELFHDLWQSREHLAAELQNLRYYLLSSLRRRLLRALEKDRRHRLQNFTDFEIIPPREHFIIQDEKQQELQKQLHAALAALPGRQREAIYLKFFHDLSYPEIADLMSMKVDSVYNIISKAIGLLKKTLPPIILVLLLEKKF
jgi:RNA polymerase sigma factor (sigma-70 family)